MSDDHKNPQEIFYQAIEFESVKDRESFLDGMCDGDDDLRAKVDGLIRAYESAGSLLEVPIARIDEDDQSKFFKASGAAENETTDSGHAEDQLAHIGPYKLLQQIGEGGMGSVYMAQQEQPVNRRVALKVIKAGMDSRQVIARFEAERQALAMMDHPNIARLLDVGTTDNGRPYFVMELVKGIPITEYCDQKRLNVAERLSLFTLVCNAVQHAHQKGIIHRDLKPNNILITEYDEKVVPKIIDFGLAKALGQNLTDKTMFTQFGQVMGTFAYMSPEQSKVNALDIDTRADIYSLGVLLYELLTGSTPFDKQTFRDAAFDQMLKIIREETPPKPSTRLSSAGTDPQIAPNRNTDATKLGKLVRGDLDWIVMKALEKERSRRYESTNALADDIHRYLKDEVIVARPPTVGYRFSKFVKKNRGLVTASTIIAASLISGIAGTSIGWYQTRAALQVADVERNRASNAAETARRQVVRLHIGKGNAYRWNNYPSEMDHGPALLWYARAWNLDNTVGAHDVNHRLRIGQILSSDPQLVGLAVDNSKFVASAVDGLGKFAITLTEDEKVHLCTLETGEKNQLPHSSQVTAVNICRAGDLAVTGTVDGIAYAWNVATGRLLNKLNHGAPIVRQGVALAPSGELAATIGGDSGVKLWNVKTGESAGTISMVSDVWSAAFDSTGGKLVTADAAGFARVWDTTTGEPLSPPRPHRRLHGGDGPVFTPNGKWLITHVPTSLAERDSKTGLPKGNCKFWAWPALSGDQPIWGPVHARAIKDYSFSPNGKLLLCAAKKQILIDLDSGRTMATGSNPRETQVVCFTSNTTYLAGSSGGVLQEWIIKPDVATDGLTVTASRIWGNAAGTFKSLVTTSNRRVVTTGIDSTIRVYMDPALEAAEKRYAYDCGRAHLLGARTNIGQSPSHVVFSPSGLTECRIEPGRRPQIGPRGADKLPITLDVSSAKWARFCGIGEALVTYDGTSYQRWHAKTGVAMGPPIVLPNDQVLMAVSEDGTSIAASTNSKSKQMVANVVIYNMAKVQQPKKISVDSQANVCRFSYDGELLLIGYSNRNIDVWDIRQYRLLKRHKLHGVVNDARFSDDSNKLILGCSDTTARMFDARTGLPAGPPLRVGSFVRRVALSPDGRRAATRDKNGRIQLWDATTGEEIGAWPNNWQGDIWFSLDGQRVILDAAIGTKTFDLSPYSSPLESLPLLLELLTGRGIDPVTDGIEDLPRDWFRRDAGAYIAAWRAWRGSLPSTSRTKTAGTNSPDSNPRATGSSHRTTNSL